MDIAPWIIYVVAAAHADMIIALAVGWILYENPERDKRRQKTWPPVSIIICAHNEAENLRHNLVGVFSQLYPAFEVIVVNDHSTDLTNGVLQVYQTKYDNLRVLNLSGRQPNKKLALDAGIKAASHNLILLTDADCRPNSPFWVQAMVNCFDKDTHIVLGFSPYTAQSGFLNKIIRYETLYTAFLYGGFAILKMPYMGVGRNLAYKKQVYLNSQAREKFASNLSGDDDLLVNEMANSKNTRICAVNEGIVWSKPKTTWAEWWHQKRRHTSAGTHYSWVSQLLLALVHVPAFLVYILAIILLAMGILISPMYFIYALCILAIRFVMVLVSLPIPINVLEQASLLPFVLICDFLLSLFLISLGCLSAIKVHTWTNYHHHNAHKKT